MRSLRSILITATVATSAVVCPVAMASGGPGGGGGGGTAPPGAPCVRIASYSAQGSNARGGILEKDVLENCGTAPITVRYHLMWHTISGTNGFLDQVKTLPAKGKLAAQHVITNVTPFHDYLVELDLFSASTGASYDVKSQLAGLFPRV